jgi:hypothetical protein
MGSERVKLSEGTVILLVTMRVINISESSFHPQHGQFEWLAPTRSPVYVIKKTPLTVRDVFTKIHHRYIHSTAVCISTLILNSTPATGEWPTSRLTDVRLGKADWCQPKTKLSGRQSRCELRGEGKQFLSLELTWKYNHEICIWNKVYISLTCTTSHGTFMKYE